MTEPLIIPDAQARQIILRCLKGEPRPVGTVAVATHTRLPESQCRLLLTDLYLDGEVVKSESSNFTPLYACAAADPFTPTQEADTMARKRTEENLDPGEQIPLIDTAHPAAKKFKKLERKMNALRSEALNKKHEADEVQEQIMAVIKDEIGAKPDADGVTRFMLDGVKVTLKPGKAQLKITEEDGGEDDDGAGDDEGDGTEADE